MTDDDYNSIEIALVYQSKYYLIVNGWLSDFNAVIVNRTATRRLGARREVKMRYWFDTEFYEDGSSINLISIGVVDEDGRTYYAETIHAVYWASQSQWLKDNVLPHLEMEERKTKETIAAELIEFMGEKPEIWAYYADYDWVVLCQLFGTMMDLPKGWPMYCRDLKQLCDMLGNPKLPEQGSGEHDAMCDALWTKDAHEWLIERQKSIEAHAA